MGLVRSAARRVAESIARVVSRNGLFEKPGERAPTPPLDDASAEKEEKEDGEPGDQPIVPVEGSGSSVQGCQKVDSSGIQSACATQGLPLVLHHWATWCEPCEEELPRIEKLAQSLEDSARVLGISWELFEAGGDPDSVVARIVAYQQSAGLSWPSLLFTDSPEALFEGLALSFERIPQTQVLGADGRLLRRFDGPLGPQEVEDVLGLLNGER